MPKNVIDLLEDNYLLECKFDLFQKDMTGFLVHSLLMFIGQTKDKQHNTFNSIYIVNNHSNEFLRSMDSKLCKYLHNKISKL